MHLFFKTAYHGRRDSDIVANHSQTVRSRSYLGNLTSFRNARRLQYRQVDSDACWDTWNFDLCLEGLSEPWTHCWKITKGRAEFVSSG